MTLRQLEYFVATVDAGSISRAALELHVAQPSLSVQLQALEREPWPPRPRGAAEVGAV